MAKGVFITFEGVDGCGKTTQSKMLYRALPQSGAKVFLTREPGGTDGANEIRRLVVTGKPGRWDPMTETLLMFAARRDHVERFIRPTIASGKWIISDRYVDSTVAYQGYGHGVPLQKIQQLHRLSTNSLYPTLTFIFDIDVEKALARTRVRGGNENRYEVMGLDFHKRLRKGFKEIARENRDRCILIDADDKVERVHRKVIEIINKKLKLNLKPVPPEGM